MNFGRPIEIQELPFGELRYIGILFFEEYPTTFVYADEERNVVIKDWVDCTDNSDIYIYYRIRKETLFNFITGNLPQYQLYFTTLDDLLFQVEEFGNATKIHIVSPYNLDSSYYPDQESKFNANDSPEVNKIYHYFNLDNLSNDNEHIFETLTSSFLTQVPELHSTNYWFVRTNKGDYFEDFYHNKFIAIGYPEIMASEIRQILDSNPINNHTQALKDFVSSKNQPIEDAQNEIEFEDEDELHLNLTKKGFAPGTIASQLLTFVSEIKTGDIIIIPNHSTNEIAIGKIKNNRLLSEDSADSYEYEACHWLKRREVDWIKRVEIIDLPEIFISLKFIRKAISNIDRLSNSVNQQINNTFRFNGNTVITFKPKAKNAKSETFKFNKLFELASNVATHVGIPFQDNSLISQVSVSSPGVIAVSSSDNNSILFFLSICIIAFGNQESKNRIVEMYNLNMQDQRIISLIKIVKSTLDELQVDYKYFEDFNIQ